jgi:hypothetical protein
MSEYESMDRSAADPSVPQPPEYPPTPGAPIPEGGPHYQADPHQVVARLPDLDRSERDTHGERPRRLRSRRREGLDPSVKIYIGAGLVLVAVVVAMFLRNGDKKTDLSENQDPEAWPLEIPRPDAPMAPAWQRPVGETLSSQPQGNLAEYGQPNGYQTAGSVDGTQRAVQPHPWPEQPRARTWGSQPDTSALGRQPQPGAWGTQPETPAWGTQQDTAVTPEQPRWGGVDTQAQAYPQRQAYPAVPSGPMPQQSASMGQVQPDASPWNVDVQAVPVPMAGVPSRQAGSSSRTGRHMGMAPSASSFDDRQAGLYRGGYEASKPKPAYRNSYQMPPSAQNGPMAVGRITSDSSYQPRDCCPPTGTTAYPAAPMTPRGNPAVIARRDDYGRGYRPGGTDTYRLEAARRQAPAGVMGSGPAADYRTAYPNATPSTSASSYPSTYRNTYPATNPQGATAAPAATYPAPNAGASTQYPQSGTARLNGVIENPTVRTTYDSTRSSLY